MFKYLLLNLQLERDKQFCQANTKKWVAVCPRWDGAPNAQVTLSKSERKKRFSLSADPPLIPWKPDKLLHPHRRWASGGWTKSAFIRWRSSFKAMKQTRPMQTHWSQRTFGFWGHTWASLEVLTCWGQQMISHFTMHNDIKGPSSVRCSRTYRVFVHCSRKALKDSKTHAATARLGAKPKQVSAKTFKSLIQKTGSGGGFGRAQFQLLSVRLHVNWIYWPRSSSAMRGSDMLDFS